MLSPKTIDQIERRALEITAELDVKLGPYRAEIVRRGNLNDAISEARWHVAATVPAGEEDAIRFLAARGFGVYLPVFETIHLVRGCKVNRYRPLFPGHIFLFVWDIKRHWRRIKACPGVARVLCVEENPVVVPPESIYRMQAIEAVGMEALMPKRSRRRRKRGRIIEPNGHEIISISPKSYWHGIERLDDNDRNRLLHKALGIETPP